MPIVFTIGELRAATAECADNDAVVIEITEEMDCAGQDLYPLSVNIIPGIKMNDQSTINEVRLVIEAQRHFEPPKTYYYTVFIEQTGSGDPTGREMIRIYRDLADGEEESGAGRLRHHDSFWVNAGTNSVMDYWVFNDIVYKSIHDIVRAAIGSKTANIVQL